MTRVLSLAAAASPRLPARGVHDAGPRGLAHHLHAVVVHDHDERAAEPLARPPPGPPRVTLAFAGDVHFEGRLEPLLDDPATALAPIAPQLSAADVTVLNLEAAITERGVPEPKQFHFRVPEEMPAAFPAAGVDALTMANNHGGRLRPDGLTTPWPRSAAARCPSWASAPTPSRRSPRRWSTSAGPGSP